MDKMLSDQPQVIRRAAMDLLARREHSRRELFNKLARKFSDLHMLDEQINLLVDQGYLSESRFTESYVRYRSENGFGPLRIMAELRQRGISEQLINEFVQAHSDRWVAVAESLMAKKSVRDKQINGDDKKLLNYLLNRGFSREQVFQAMQQQAIKVDELAEDPST